MDKPRHLNQKKIIVNIKDQVLKAFLNEEVIYKFRCVTGDANHPTPKGKFKIIRKERIYRSKTYDAQMNYALQITDSGIFIHEGYNTVENPMYQNPFATILSDTATSVFSLGRSWFPTLDQKEFMLKNINLTGSHGCIRLSHRDAVKIFEWADVKTGVVVE